MNITKRRMFPALLTILLFATLLADVQASSQMQDKMMHHRKRLPVQRIWRGQESVYSLEQLVISTYRTMKAMKQEPKSSVITRVQMPSRR